MKLIKRIVALITIVSTLVLSSCSHFKMNQYAGMQMGLSGDCATIKGYSGLDENVYFPPTYNRFQVEFISGKKNSYFIGSSRTARFEGPNLKRVYFPWSVRRKYDINSNTTLSRVFSEGCIVIFTRFDDIVPSRRTVVPMGSYNIFVETGELGGWSPPSYHNFSVEPSNVAYSFNYPDAPNENYFFIDLVESTGKLLQPPYDPEREGYAFRGWYKDAECTERWDFYKDVVEVSYDENGNRIYEELWLYAKWEKNNWWEFWK